MDEFINNPNDTPNRYKLNYIYIKIMIKIKILWNQLKNLEDTIENEFIKYNLNTNEYSPKKLLDYLYKLLKYYQTHKITLCSCHQIQFWKFIADDIPKKFICHTNVTLNIFYH